MGLIQTTAPTLILFKKATNTRRVCASSINLESVDTSNVKNQNSLEILLDVCIPTFNRAHHLDSLLTSLAAAIEFGDLSNVVRVRVSDNSSLDDTRQILSKWRSKEPNWDLSSRDHNIGMIRNFDYLISTSSARFTWLLGDDDELLSVDSLLHLVDVLNSEEPLLIVLAGKYETQLTGGSGVSRFFSSGSFISFVSGTDPDFLRRHTWISLNIFQREVFDLHFARENLMSWYMHMYGLFRGLSRTPGKIVLIEEEIVQPSNSMGFRENSFPDFIELRLEWIHYFSFLSQEFSEPSLATFSKRWRPGATSYLRRFVQTTLKFLHYGAKLK